MSSRGGIVFLPGYKDSPFAGEFNSPEVNTDELRCSFCGLGVARVSASHGQRLVGFRESLKGGLFDRAMLPDIRKSVACTRCAHKLDTTLPNRSEG